MCLPAALRLKVLEKFGSYICCIPPYCRGKVWTSMGKRCLGWVRPTWLGQDEWKELCTILSSAHQSSPGCWLLTCLRWLVLTRLPESHCGGEEFLCPSPFTVKTLHRCCNPPRAEHPCGKEQVCLYHLLWVGSLRKCLDELRHRVLTPAPSPQSPPSTISMIISSMKSAETTHGARSFLLRSLLLRSFLLGSPPLENEAAPSVKCFSSLQPA